MGKRILIIMVLLLFFLLPSCEYTDIKYDTPVVDEKISFSTDIEPIFKLQSCTNCHNETLKPDLSVGNAYKSLIENECIDTTNPAGSKIYLIPKTGNSHAATFTNLQSQQMLTWIEQGAKNN
jgi:hypothetical protein